jgi:hypothetical protein
VDGGTNYNGTYFRSGRVEVSDLTCYFHDGVCPFPVTTQALAHLYGEVTQASDCGNYTTISNVTNSQQTYQYYCRNDSRPEFAYRFNEYNPNDTQKAYPYFSNRTFTTSSGKCLENSQVGEPTSDTVGSMSALKHTYTNGSTNGTISIPVSSLGREGTTYIYRGTDRPAIESTYNCSDRGFWMWAYRNPGRDEAPRFYQCPIEVSLVSNVQQSAHIISNDVARVAAASIALQGRYHPEGDRQIFTQYQFYASG